MDYRVSCNMVYDKVMSFLRFGFIGCGNNDLSLRVGCTALFIQTPHSRKYFFITWCLMYKTNPHWISTELIFFWYVRKCFHLVSKYYGMRMLQVMYIYNCIYATIKRLCLWKTVCNCYFLYSYSSFAHMMCPSKS